MTFSLTNRALQALALFSLAACSEPGEEPARIPEHGLWNTGVELAAEPQEPGDPTNGEFLLLNGDFMTCGLPYRMWNFPFAQSVIASAFGANAEVPLKTLPGREGKNADMPYFINAFTASDGTEVVNGNCLMCHASQFDGEVIIGMPNATADFTGGGAVSPDDLGGAEALYDLVDLTEAERVQADRMFTRANIMLPYTGMRTIGMNPAEMFALVLMVHHDRETLAWSDEPVVESLALSVLNGDFADPKITSDPAPWWRVKKKNALFYNGMARGDHRGTMSLATSVCVDDLDRAAEVDRQFRDIQAFVKSVEAPRYPRKINAELAQKGERVFIETCAGCHGTYGTSDDAEWYPNLLIPLDVIGTDDVVALGGVLYAPELVEWYNNSFYGKVTRMVPDDPFPGYIPPPLDGIWATGPFLHNGSVPTIEAVLNSSIRPKYWRRVDYDSSNFDEAALGWPYEEVPYSQRNAPEAERKFIYDTTLWSQSNKGHTFGDHLSQNDRRAVLEYLKTL
jgi:mono/diheme cytochrome c family protein